MSEEMNIVPELRFPEFVEFDIWEKKKLADVADLKNGYTFKSSSYVETGNYGIVTIGNVQQGRLATDSIKKIDKVPNDVQRHQILQIGDILISMTGNVGRTCIVNEENLLLNQRVGKIIPENILSNYLYQYTQRNQFIENLQKSAVGGAQGNISTSDIREIKLPVPKNPQEQQKIASCLSSLDELLAAHNDKLDALKEHKKGLMQNLFPQEGETVPKVRFPEFEGDGEWDSEPLQEICKLVRGPFGGALKKEIFVEKGYAVYEQSHAIYSDFSNFRYRINDEKYHELKRFSVRASDLIMSCSGTMGKFSMIPSDFEEGVINQALLKLTVKTGYDVSFIKTSLETETNQRQLLSQSAGGAIKNVVSVSQIRILELSVPGLKEQQKIASCLSAVDELITDQQEKIEQLQQHKKGLMQGLFPNSSTNSAVTIES